MIIDGKSLELLLHVDGQMHILEGPILAHVHGALEWNAAPIRVVPIEVRIEREQNVDQRLQFGQKEGESTVWLGYVSLT